MTIIGVTCVKNEEDIIEAFVRHNLFYLQKLIVLNHGSTDNTSAILSRLVAEGLPLVVEDDLSLGKFQAEKMTRLMHLAVDAHGADWVLPLDADELIRCAADRLPLPDIADSTTFLKVAWRTYQVRPSDDQTIINPAERIRHRLAKEPCEDLALDKRSHLLKAIVPRALAGAPGACVSKGNHSVIISNQHPEYTFWPGFDYAHFSMRSAGQYSSKVAISCLQEAYRSSHRGGNSSHYLTHLEEFKNDFDGFSQRFYERLPSYMEQTPSFTPVVILDPLRYRGGPLRYTPSANDYSRLVSNLIGYADVLVKEAAQHAALSIEANQVEEIARLEFYGQEPSGVLTHNISASSRLLQTVRFDLGALALSSVAHLRLSSLSAVVEIVKVRWIWDAPQTDSVLSGKLLREKAFLVENSFAIQHEEYLNFIKGNGDTVIGLEVPPARNGCVAMAVEIQLQMETDPTRIGVKLLQSDIIGGVLATSQPMELLERRVAQLSKKLEQRTTLPGAVGFQLYRLWRTAARLFGKTV